MSTYQQLNRSVFLSGLFALMGMFFFAVSVYMAIRAFDNYSMTRHVLSDLGATQNWRGKDNSASATWFNSGLVILGLSLLPFCSRLSIDELQREWKLRVPGIMSAVGLIGIGMTPYDRFLLLHNLALAVWLIGLLGLMLAFLFSIRRVGRNPTIAILALGLIGILMVAYLVAVGQSGHAVFQKLLVLASLVWFLYLFASVSVTVLQSLSSARQAQDRLATDYLESIRVRYRR